MRDSTKRRGEYRNLSSSSAYVASRAIIGKIEYRRGSITILDHAGLEAASCPCYALVKGMNDAKRKT